MATQTVEPNPSQCGSIARRHGLPRGTGGFPKSARLLKRHDFLRLARNGRKVHTGLFLAVFCKGDRDRARLGVTVTRKVGPATRRNRIKRMVREVFRANREQFSDPLDINVIAKKASALAEAEQVRSSLAELFSRIRGGASSER